MDALTRAGLFGSWAALVGLAGCADGDACQPTDCPAPVEILVREAEPGLLVEPLMDLHGVLTLGVEGELIADFDFACPGGIGDCSGLTDDGLILDTDGVEAGGAQLVFFRIYDGGADRSPDLLDADHAELYVEAADGRVWAGGAELSPYDEPGDTCGCEAQVATVTVVAD